MRFAKSPCSKDAAGILQQIASRPAKKAARKIDKPLAIYGAGKLGKMAVELLERIGIPPPMVVDANPGASRNDPFWHDRAILSPHEVSPDARATYLLAVSIATLPYEELAVTLADQGWCDIVPFYDVAEAYRDVYPLSNGWVLDQFDDTDVAATQEVLETWGDDISRAHHLQFLAWHRFREDWMFSDAPVNVENRYFIPEVLAALGEQEAFVDVGAHQGEISERFRATVHNRYKGIWMIEPDPRNYAQIQKWILAGSHKERDRIHLLPYAVAGASGPRLFYGGIGYASQLSTVGQKMIDVTTVDQLNLSPTFMKIHLEGWELEALNGATETIRRCNPMLAVTSYHSHLGVWQLPMWLINRAREMGVGYRFLLRLHSWCGTGAVIYVIPEGKAKA